MNTTTNRLTGTLTRQEVIMAVGAILAVALPLAFGGSGWTALAAFFAWVVLAEVFGLTLHRSPDPVQGFLRRQGYRHLADALNVGPASREELWLLVGLLAVGAVLAVFAAYALALVFFWVFCVPVALLTAGLMLLPR